MDFKEFSESKKPMNMKSIEEVSSQTKVNYIKAARKSIQSLDKAGKDEKRDNRSIAANRVYNNMTDKEKHMSNVKEEVKTTHENPLVAVKDHNGHIYTHANLSVANAIHQANVKHQDIHTGKPVKAGKFTFELSQHHAAEVKGETMNNKKGVTEDFGTTAAVIGGAALGAKIGKTIANYKDAKSRENAGHAKPRKPLERLKASWKGVSHADYGDESHVKKEGTMPQSFKGFLSSLNELTDKQKNTLTRIKMVRSMLKTSKCFAKKKLFVIPINLQEL